MCSKYKFTTYQPKLVIIAFNEIRSFPLKDRCPYNRTQKCHYFFKDICWYLCLDTHTHIFIKIVIILIISYLKAQLCSKYNWFRAKQYSVQYLRNNKILGFDRHDLGKQNCWFAKYKASPTVNVYKSRK